MTRDSLNLESLITPLTGKPGDFDALLSRIGNAQFVLLGEASHGTHEFYHCRAEITKRLIAECGFSAVAVEADWPDAQRVNQFVRLESNDASAHEALSDFERFPQWMWRNTDVLEFVEWLRAHNETIAAPDERAEFVGLDLYSLHTSMAAVLKYLGGVDADAAARARARYSCFDHFGTEPQRYGYLTSLGVMPSCEQEALDQLMEMNRTRASHLHFSAEQNARLVRNAERYYRMMFAEGEHAWNFRDEHMADTLEALTEQLQQFHRRPRIVVWAHNSHLGDARATEMSRRGEFNLGQLVRERFPSNSVHVGFSTHSGTVMAANDWDAPMQVKNVRAALTGSYEDVMHQQSVQNFLLDLRAGDSATQSLMEARLERAIGVIYRPATERHSHYFQAILPQQFDCLVHFDVTTAVTPLA